ncbi:MAG: ABC transporter permease [Bryobacterales bacterium]|nr:ABC transporter permease [Bryobacterales bacterium]
MSANEAAGQLIRVYRVLARLFPEEFRDTCGPDMLIITEDLVRDAAQAHGWRGLAPLAAKLFADMLARLVAEYCNELWADVRHAARVLWGSPGFTLLSVLSLAMGISTATLMYSELDSTIFRALPGAREPETIVIASTPVSYPVYRAFREESGQFESLAAFVAPVPFMMGEGNRVERVWGHVASPAYFHVLGLRPARGRFFDTADEQFTGEQSMVAVISHAFWQTRLLRDPAYPGAKLRVNGKQVTVIGIAPADFQGVAPMVAKADLWVPLSAQSRIAPETAPETLENWKAAAFQVVGRLKPGVDRVNAASVLDTLARRVEASHGVPAAETDKGQKIRLWSGGQMFPLAPEDAPMVTAFPAVLAALVLWIACANVATMMLVRGARRQKELSLRLALGASRARLLRHLLTESVLLALISGVAGWFLTVWSLWTVDWIKPLMPQYVDMRFFLDWKTFLFNFLVAAGVGVLFGLAPALQASKVDLISAMKQGGQPPLRRFRWFSTRNLLVLQQVAASLALLLITGYVALGFQRSKTLDLGFRAEDLTSISLDPVREGMNVEQVRPFLARLLDRVKSNPEVTGVSLATSPPLSPFQVDAKVEAMTGGDALALLRRTRVAAVGAGYFDTLELPLLRGRGFVEADERDGRRVTVLNETAARDAFPDRDPLGQRIDLDGATYEVIGVARDLRTGFAFEHGKRGAYTLMDEWSYREPRRQGVILLVRTRPGADGAAAVRRELASMDARVTPFDIKTMTQTVEELRYLVRITVYVYAGFGVFGLLLAAIGLGGVTAYAVAQRTKEIGIRLALGAQRSHVLGLVLREGLWLVIGGAILGQAGAWGISKALSRMVAMLSELMETTASDPVLVYGAPALLTVLTLLACYLPARQCLRIDPAVTLRE